MINIVFVCLGNICRSPMAEFVFRDMLKKEGLSDKIHVESAATSTEEIGNGVHRGTCEKLAQKGISVAGKTAVQLKKSDYEKFDYIIAMEDSNIRGINRIIGNDKEGKVYKLLDFAGGGNIADPWNTGNFDVTYNDVYRGCVGLMEYLKQRIV